MKQRAIAKIHLSQATNDGEGVKICRVAIYNDMTTLDPFLLFDEFGSDDAADYIGGFPSHPHRGFETVTYMLEGAFTHEDHMGNVGHLRTGGVQWMTAGKGVIHSEMPEQDKGRMRGFQIWINLPAKDKMQPARYQEFNAEEIPEIQLEGGGFAKVIAGFLLGKTGPVTKVATQPSYFNIQLLADKQIDLPTPMQHTVIVYVYGGSIYISEEFVKQGQMAQLDEGDVVNITTSGGANFLFLSAAPIKEPVVQHGPFVMNTKQEIQQAIEDYRMGRLTD